jgi:hypothetical protein
MKETTGENQLTDTTREEVGWSRAAQDPAEAASPRVKSGGSKEAPREAGRRGPHRFCGPVPLSVLSMLFAIFATIIVWFDVVFTFDKRTALFVGANIEHALADVSAAGILGLLLIGFVRRKRRLLIALLVFEAATLGAALVLVALDRATYNEQLTCDFLCFGSDKPYTETHHLWFLYLLWGLPFAALLVQAARVMWEPSAGLLRRRRQKHDGRT